MTSRLSAASVILLASVFAVAQDAPPITGKWSGSYRSGQDTTIRVVLDIKDVEGEKVQGAATLYSTARRPQCAGDYAMAGTLKGKELRVRSTEKGGPGGDCTLNLSAVVEGNKLLAKRGQTEFEMTR
jgi:hypothetical protein